MSGILEKFIQITSEFSRIQKLPQPYKDKDDNFPFPRQLRTGNDRYITISKSIDQLIADVARTMRNNSSLKSHFAASDYLALVKQAFGPALAKVDINAPTKNAQPLLAEVEKKVSEMADRALNDGGREYAFGCTLFTYDDFPEFEIGPARFEPRLVWLDRKTSDGCWVKVSDNGLIKKFEHQLSDGPISKTIKQRITQAWQGEILKPQEPSFENRYEDVVLKAIDRCPYVCSVKVPGAGGKSSKDKALLASRLALTTISLIWESSSKALDGINLHFDREMRNQYLLSFTPEGLILGSGTTSNMPHAPWTNRTELENFFQEFSLIFRISGEAINWLINPTQEHDKPKLLNVISQAMLWFHDGCREITDIKAIVCFASCMDVLASGGGQKDICKLINARLGLDESSPIHRDGLTVKEVINQIYDDGRTRFVHGPMKFGKNVWKNKLGNDWSETRGLAEWLARMCLINSMEWISANTGSDNPALLLTE